LEILKFWELLAHSDGCLPRLGRLRARIGLGQAILDRDGINIM